MIIQVLILDVHFEQCSFRSLTILNGGSND